MCHVFLNGEFTSDSTVMRCASCTGCGTCPNRLKAQQLKAAREERRKTFALTT